MAIKSDQTTKSAAPKTASKMDPEQTRIETRSEGPPEITEHVHNNNKTNTATGETNSSQSLANRQPESRPEVVDEDKEPRGAEVKGYRCQFSPAVSAAARNFVEQRLKQHALEKERMARERERLMQEERRQQEGAEREKVQKARKTPARRVRKSPGKAVVADEDDSDVSGDIKMGQKGPMEEARRRDSVDELFDFEGVELGF